ncbi:hypothetical protein DUNSADRAFT_13343 [Dunaliella salina]|uniref:Encoded protein n=1 Tax=Dunaliella salina TaxID=3046 RepID=A0ABQ7G9K4_DUNSA|nr:hypothetical protein DUNSADRAFT_13343 [Dunaliella salina]|eukprot:KAF5831287.1 hypothetical protein DUNSADRAFT_13343 [Dunaliella salina]
MWTMPGATPAAGSTAAPSPSVWSMAADATPLGAGRDQDAAQVPGSQLSARTCAMSSATPWGAARTQETPEVPGSQFSARTNAMGTTPRFGGFRESDDGGDSEEDGVEEQNILELPTGARSLLGSRVDHEPCIKLPGSWTKANAHQQWVSSHEVGDHAALGHWQTGVSIRSICCPQVGVGHSQAQVCIWSSSSDRAYVSAHSAAWCWCASLHWILSRHHCGECDAAQRWLSWCALLLDLRKFMNAERGGTLKEEQKAFGAQKQQPYRRGGAGCLIVDWLRSGTQSLEELGTFSS